MNRIAVGNLLMSAILTMLGVYDVRHELVGYGIVELWIGGVRYVRQTTQWPNFTWVKDTDNDPHA